MIADQCSVHPAGIILTNATSCLDGAREYNASLCEFLLHDNNTSAMVSIFEIVEQSVDVFHWPDATNPRPIVAWRPREGVYIAGNVEALLMKAVGMRYAVVGQELL